MIIIDEVRIFKEIEEKKPASVSLNGPDGMLPQVQDMAMKITKKYDIPAYVLADTTWGTCDLNTTGSKILGADVQFNIGHTINTESLEKNLVLIDAFDDVEFDSVANKCTKLLKDKVISLVTDSQHLHQMDKVEKILTENGINVKIGKGKDS